MTAEDLVRAALTARQNAYAPYSNYFVGAAVLDENGAVSTGCNVENASYPVGMCAERVAIGKMVVTGARQIEAIAVATEDGGTPCGMCLQAISEFVPNVQTVEVHCCTPSGGVRTYKFAELLPIGFALRTP